MERNNARKDRSNWQAVQKKVNKWIEDTGADVCVLYVPRTTKKNPVPTLQYEGSDKLIHAVEQSNILDFLTTESTPKTDVNIKDKMEEIARGNYTFDGKRCIVSQLVRQYIFLKYGIQRDFWGLQELKPEWWPIEIPFISPNERRNIENPLTSQQLTSVLDSYVSWKSDDSVDSGDA